MCQNQYKKLVPTLLEKSIPGLMVIDECLDPMIILLAF